MNPLMLAVLTQVGNAAPPPAPPAPPSPPLIVTVGPSRAAYPPGRRSERSTVDVEVRAGAELLWSGPMVVATNQGSSFTRRLAEPAPDECTPSGYGQQVENSLTVQLTPRRQSQGDDALGVSVRWGRSLPGTCPLGTSSRSVELSETVALVPGRAVTLTGDGNLLVRLRRR